MPAAEVDVSSDEAPALVGTPLRPPKIATKIENLLAVVLPFLGLIAAFILMWSPRFGWINLALLLGGYVITALGITVGYHRLFTHRSFKTSAPMRAILGIMGSMAAQGPILEWCATHRRHHQHTDRPEDPHSPHVHGTEIGSLLKGMYHSHVGWFFTPGPSEEYMRRYVPDLRKDKVVVWVSKLVGVWTVLGLLIPGAIGLWATHSWMGALLGFLWGGLLRVFLVHHVTWSVNSICHIWGAQPFDTHDESRNNPIFGILSMGEGWHNNHHAFPSSARHGLEWWQLDLSALFIRGLVLLRLASEVKVPTRERIEAKRKAG